jgi:hypothetical protein
MLGTLIVISALTAKVSGNDGLFAAAAWCQDQGSVVTADTRLEGSSNASASHIRIHGELGGASYDEERNDITGRSRSIDNARRADG